MNWTCPACDTINQSDAEACMVCGAVRPPAHPVQGDPATAVLFASPEAEVRAAAAPADRYAPGQYPLGQGSTAAPAAGEPGGATWCPACGTAVAVGLSFCGACGAAQGVRAAPAHVTAAATTTAPIVPPGTAPPRGSGRLVLSVAAVVLACLLIGAGAFVVTSRASSTTPTTRSTRDGETSTGDGGSVSTIDDTTSTASSSSSTSSTTTTIATTTTTNPEAKFAPPGTPDDVLAALALAQELATALAARDAETVGRIEPAKAGVDLSGYVGLDVSTPVLRMADVRGETYVLHLGLVAHETTDGAKRTSIYCSAWTVDMASRHITEGTTTTAEQYEGEWVDVVTLVPVVQQKC